jgi:hypothetical protein
MDQFEVLQLLATYAWSHDSRQFDKLATCFAPDAEYTMRIADNPPSSPTIGGEAIAALVRSFKEKQTDQRRHVISNVVFHAFRSDYARTSSYVTVLATTPEASVVVATGTCVDEVVVRDGVVVFHSKAMHLDKSF